MTALEKIELPRGLTIPQFLEWASRQEGRYELAHGEVFAMVREAVAHSRTKLACTLALAAGIRRGGLSCEAILDGPGVTLLNNNYFVPDVIVVCGERIDGGLSIVPNPLIVVEVVSPSTEGYDKRIKFADYFLIPSITHYLLVYIERRLILHHKRVESGTILTEIVRDSDITLDPPGLTVTFAELFGE